MSVLQSNPDGAPLNVLSVNVFMMGHITFQRMLEGAFKDSPTVRFRSHHLMEEKAKDFWGRVVFYLLTRRLFGMRTLFYRFRSEWAMSYLAIRVVNRAITADQPDVIHLHTQSIALLAHRRPSGIPLVISLDATSALLAREMDSPGDLRPAIAAERRAFQGAAHIVAWTRWAAQSVVNDYGVEPERVTVVYPSVPFGPLLAIHLERDATGRKVRILFVGNDFERKGGFELLSAFHAHFKTRCELHIVSNQGPKNAGEGVFIHSGLSPMSPELVNLYRDADVFVLPTREDVCGLVFIEAMAAGLPMIGTNVMGVTEIVGDGQTGFLIPRQAPEVLRAALDRLVSNPALRAQMGTAGRARALADFQPAVNAERIGEIFKRVARSKG